MLMVGLREVLWGVGEGRHEVVAIVPEEPGEGQQLELGAAAPARAEMRDRGPVEAVEASGGGIAVAATDAAGAVPAGWERAVRVAPGADGA